jgi:Dynein heavy chain, N-terminal region 1
MSPLFNEPTSGCVLLAQPVHVTPGKSSYIFQIFKKMNFRKDIGRRLIAKTGHIIKKFVHEIEDAEKDFRAKSENPPVAENLPPISGRALDRTCP